MPRPAAGQRVTCPACGQQTSDQPIEGTLTVCESCARSLVLEEDGARLATGADLAALSPSQVQELRVRRPNAWRQDVRARHARIVAGR